MSVNASLPLIVYQHKCQQHRLLSQADAWVQLCCERSRRVIAAVSEMIDDIVTPLLHYGLFAVMFEVWHLGIVHHSAHF
jgi:hypothetical protein